MSSLANNYNRRKISFRNGKGSFLYSTSGKKYLDMVSGIAVNSLGHSHPHLLKALTKQAKRVSEDSQNEVDKAVYNITDKVIAK